MWHDGPHDLEHFVLPNLRLSASKDLKILVGCVCVCAIVVENGFNTTHKQSRKDIKYSHFLIGSLWMTLSPKHRSDQSYSMPF